MKIHKRMFFARGDTLCNDTTELSVVEFHNILSAAFVVPALKPQESRKSLKPQEVLEQIRKDNFEWFDWVEENWEKKRTGRKEMDQVPTQFSSGKTTSMGKCYFLQHNNHSLTVYSFLEKFN